jgi:hypothetical protein
MGSRLAEVAEARQRWEREQGERDLALLERPARWTWRAGARQALAHRFDFWSEDDGATRAVVEPVVEAFDRLPAGEPVTTTYQVRVDDGATLPLVLFADQQRLASCRVAEELLAMLTWHINRTVITRTTATHVLLHAAGVVRDGVTVVLAADQESGKTTTAAGLLRSGFDYVTDEAVAIDPASGRIDPFTKNLSIDPGSWPLFPECAPAAPNPRVQQWQVRPADLGSRAVRRPVASPGVVLFPKYRAGAVTELVPVSKAEAVRELAQMSFGFAEHAQRNLTTLGGLAARATVTARLTIGSLDDAVRLVNEAVDSVVAAPVLEEA